MKCLYNNINTASASHVAWRHLGFIQGST